MINWISIICEVMKKAKKSITYKFPYVVLIYKIIEHFKIDVVGEVYDDTATDYEISRKHLAKMGLKETSDGKWVMSSE